jgi:polyhydroxybutyrate depolymerase
MTEQGRQPMSRQSLASRSIAVAIALLVAVPGFARIARAETISVTTTDGQRTAIFVRAPAASAPPPLVVVLHGGFGTAEQVQAYMGWDRVAREDGFAVLYPQGLQRRWNDARAAALRKLNPSTASDVAFIRALVERIVKSGAADPARIYVTGVSNGGHMTHRLVCEAGELFAAAAPVIANLAANLVQACPSKPMPMLLMNGTADTLTPYAGETAQGGSVLSAPDTFAAFARRNGCTGTPGETRLPDREPSDGSTVTVIAGTGCTHETKLYRINGGGHNAPARQKRPDGLLAKRLFGTQNQDIDTAEEIWAFFKTKRK